MYVSISATVSTLKTTSGFGETGNTVIWRRPTLETILDRSTCNYRTITAKFRRKTASDSHFWPNREWKYGGNRTHELAAIDFLFDPYTLRGLSWLLLPLCRRDRYHWPIVKDMGQKISTSCALVTMALQIAQCRDFGATLRRLCAL